MCGRRVSLSSSRADHPTPDAQARTSKEGASRGRRGERRGGARRHGTRVVGGDSPAQPSQPSGHHTRGIQHVLLISVDGMHQSDLEWYVVNHPDSELARLATRGAEYTDAQTADPSDSDPGGTALMTGGDPKVTGIYYDDEYSHGVFPPGTTSCSGPVPGGDVIYDSPDDKLPAVPDLLHNGSASRCRARYCGARSTTSTTPCSGWPTRSRPTARPTRRRSS
jgi:hypothetical protein